MVPVPTRAQVNNARLNLKWAADHAGFACYGYEPTRNTHQMLMELNAAAKHLGFALVPLAVTDAKGFDGRADGGRMDEISSAQEDAP